MISRSDVETPFRGPEAILLGDSGCWQGLDGLAKASIDFVGVPNNLAAADLTGLLIGVAGGVVKAEALGISSLLRPKISVSLVSILWSVSVRLFNFNSSSSGWTDLKSSLTPTGRLVRRFSLISSGVSFLFTGGGATGLVMRKPGGVDGHALGSGVVLAGVLGELKAASESFDILGAGCFAGVANPGEVSRFVVSFDGLIKVDFAGESGCTDGTSSGSKFNFLLIDGLLWEPDKSPVRRLVLRK